MCEYLDFQVKDLQRIRIMHIKLDLQSGKYRKFTKIELEKLNQLTKTSNKAI